jgi:hypothetical protein
MEEFIGGGVSGVLARPPVTFAYSSLPIQSGNVFTWTHEELALWPPPGIRPVALYLNQDSTLSPERPAQENGILNVRNDWSGTYPLDSGFVDGFHGERFDQNLPRESVAFMSAPLGGDCFWIGAPTMHLHIGSYYSRFPLHAQVFEVDQAGSKHFINRIPFTARGWVPGSIERADVRGLAHAHLFRKGNRIRLELSNIDGEARFLWGDVPFTVPMFAVASAALFMDEQRPSWIELPMLGDPSLPNSIGILAADADARTGTVRLSWQTPAERNNAGFVVERSGTSATGFVAIATLPPAAGPVSAGPTRYECLDTNRQIGRWYYRVRQIDEDGTGHLSQVITVDVLTAVSGGTEPLAFVLEQNSPNPFNPSTAISYQVPRGGPVRLAVFDILGREVALLVNGPQPPGRYSVRFDGSRFSSGVYLCRLEAGGSAAVRRMLLLK